MLFEYVLILLTTINYHHQVQPHQFTSVIDNLLLIDGTPTLPFAQLFAVSDRYLYQLHWNHSHYSHRQKTTTLLLHRRVQLHSSIVNDNDQLSSPYISVFVFDSQKELLLLCGRSKTGRC
ncbi:unnamed protein product, partial [Didymodactylos carnosus]